MVDVVVRRADERGVFENPGIRAMVESLTDSLIDVNVLLDELESP